MFKETKERRKKMFRKALKGIPPAEWVEEIAEEYDIQEQSVYNDWSRRKSWLEEVFDLEEVAYIINYILAEKGEVRKAAWKLLGQATDDNTKTRLLKLIDKAAKEHVELLQSMGKVTKELGKEEIEIKWVMDDEY